jgi:WhiB family redox-sensing transcriptional regulator
MEAIVAPEWVADALCAQTDPELFFPTKGGDGSPAAKAVCRRCPVRAECLALAVSDPSLDGIWGGTSNRERQALRKQQPGRRAA